MPASLQTPFGRRATRPLLVPPARRMALPQPLWTMDFVRHPTLGAGQGRPGLDFSRNSPAWDPLRGVTVGANVPRLNADGLLIEGARRNYLHDSASPATQTRSLDAGTYTLSIEGTGSVVLSGGPVGTASAGSPATFTLASTTGVTFTVSGTVERFQCETDPGNTADGLFATSFIATPPGDGATRELDFVSGTDLSWFNPAEGSFLVAFRFNEAASNTGTQRILTLTDGTANNRIDVNRNDAVNDGAIRFIGSELGSNVILFDSDTVENGCHTIAFGYRTSESRLFLDGVEVPATLNNPFGALSSINQVHLGSTWIGTNPLSGYVVSMAYWPDRKGDEFLRSVSSIIAV